MRFSPKGKLVIETSVLVTGCKHGYFCCLFLLTKESVGTTSLVALASSSHLWNCSFQLMWSGFIFQWLMLPLDFHTWSQLKSNQRWERAEEVRKRHTKIRHPCLAAFILKQSQLNMTFGTAASSVSCFVTADCCMLWFQMPEEHNSPHDNFYF